MQTAQYFENYQRVGFLALVPQAVRRFGVDPVAVLVEAGLKPYALDDPEDTIPYTSMGRLLEVAAEKTQCPYFGLEIGKQIRSSTLGLIGELMRNCQTVGAALQEFAKYQYQNSHGGVAYTLADGQDVFFGYAIYQPNMPGSQYICDGAAMAAFNLVRELAGPDAFADIEVHFSRSEPDDLAPYRRLFGVNLSFDSRQTAVRVPLSLLNRPIAGASVEIRRAIRARINELWDADDLDIETRLRRALRTSLLTGRTSAEEVSGQIGLRARTLHRRLDAIGLGFQQVLNETRCEFTQQLLANTRLGVGEIACIVGYTKPSVLTRQFALWTGMSPSQWRMSLSTVSSTT
jgi:AraC-like DNA-binding protein